MPRAPERTIPLPTREEATTEQVLEEYGAAAELLQQAAQDASQEGDAQVSSNLHISAGIMTDRWRDLRDAEIPLTLTYTPSSLYCECHTSPLRYARARKLLTDWHRKALLACRQMVASVHERDSNVRGAAKGSSNVRNWANSAGVSVQKIILYANDAAAAGSGMEMMHAHRADVLALMEKLNVAREQIAAIKGRHG